MDKRPAQAKQNRVSATTARKEDALELAQILYDIYVEQARDEDADNEQVIVAHNNIN